MYIDTIEKICDTDKNIRRKNICAMLGGNYTIQADSRSTNVIIPAKCQSEKVIALTAHYDVFPKSMGYNDNGSAIATIMAIKEKIPDNVEIIFTDNEEIGGKGADLYLQKEGSRVLFNLNVDVVGLGSKIYYDKFDPAFDYTRRDPIILLDQTYDAVSYDGVPFNDSWIFKMYNIPTVLVVAGSAPYSGIISEIWKHQHRNEMDDIIGLLSEEGMDRVANFILDTLWFNYDNRHHA
jgi:hypothetical protein